MITVEPLLGGGALQEAALLLIMLPDALSIESRGRGKFQGSSMDCQHVRALVCTLAHASLERALQCEPIVSYICDIVTACNRLSEA